MVPVLIVPVLNRYDLLARLILSIDHSVGVLHIIDNGGKYQNVPNDYVQDTVVWRVPDHHGAATSWNFGIIANQSAPWWLIAGNDNYFHPGALATFAAEARQDAVILSAAIPAWTAFTIGDRVITKVGLFDDNFHPAYFEDNDYADRCQHFSVDVIQGNAKVHHDNSSTIHSDRQLFEWNHTVSFPASQSYYSWKRSANDYTAGRIDLFRRKRTAFPK